MSLLARRERTRRYIGRTCSIAVPMQCAPVEHAEEIEYEMP